MIIAKENFRDEELLEPKAVFEQAGYKVVIFSTAAGKAKGMLGAEVSVDKTISQLQIKDFLAVVFIGGSGAMVYWNNKMAQQIAQETLVQGKVLGAICLAPVTLANAGILKGKRATVWLSEADRLTNAGAQYTGKGVTVDGRIVTADGPQSARQFAETILDLLG